MINGNSIDVKVDGCNSEIKANIVVSTRQSTRLWGQIKTGDGQPVADALIKLIKVVQGKCECEYQGIAHTVSDCKGFYQFDLCPEETGACYKVIVGKATADCQSSACPPELNCNLCNPSSPCSKCEPGFIPCNCKPIKNCCW
jgi:hypothetical protein